MKQRIIWVFIVALCAAVSGCGDEAPQVTGSGILNCTDAPTQEQRESCMEKKKEMRDSDLGADPTPQYW